RDERCRDDGERIEHMECCDAKDLSPDRDEETPLRQLTANADVVRRQCEHSMRWSSRTCYVTSFDGRRLDVCCWSARTIHVRRAMALTSVSGRGTQVSEPGHECPSVPGAAGIWCTAIGRPMTLFVLVGASVNCSGSHSGYAHRHERSV